MSDPRIHHAGDNITGVAVAIRRQPEGHTHTGVIFREKSQLSLVHLQWDLDLSFEVFDGTYSWVIPELLAEEINDIRALCRKIGEFRPAIHYGFRFDPEATLDKDTALLISDKAPYGLTCSSFVIAIFKSAEVPLVQADTWTEREDDARWYSKLLRAMGRTGVDPEHIKKVENDVKVVRIRPEETAGACLEKAYPVDFNTTQRNATALMKEIDMRFPPNRST